MLRFTSACVTSCKHACMQGGFQSIRFRRIRCTFACCSGKIVVQKSEIDGGRTPPGLILQSRMSGRFWRCGGCLPCSKTRREIPNITKYDKNMVKTHILYINPCDQLLLLSLQLATQFFVARLVANMGCYTRKSSLQLAMERNCVASCKENCLL